MKHIRFCLVSIMIKFSPLMCMAVLLVACTKNTATSFDENCRMITGSYHISEMVLLESELDLDGDGFSGNDLTKELNSYDTCRDRLTNEIMVVRPAMGFNRSCESFFSIPLQNISYDQQEAEYRLEHYSGTGMTFSFSYLIDMSNQCRIEMGEIFYGNCYDDFSSVIKCVESKEVKVRSIELVQPGVIQVDYDCPFLDLTAKEYATHKVRIVYRRIENE